MIDAYLNGVERWTAGPESRKRQIRAEVAEHLAAAEQAGDLDGAIARLGTPREAATTFSEGYSFEPAPVPRRLGAALIDMAIFAGLLTAAAGIGAMSAAQSDDGSGTVAIAVVAVLMFVGAGFWWAIGLTLMEWRVGRTPGKAALGLRVIAETGIAPSFPQVLVRRLTLVFSGPLQIIDWVFMFFNPKHQRAFDIIARTVVVQDERSAALEMAPAS
ncbi:MAG TPA: RDD family protein [Actinomycetota bacterium]|nr:RDD family protein [Actinomycetota bacterium]